MFEVTVAARFEAAHRLVGDFGPAARTHGHTYRLEVTVRGEALAPDGTLIDVGSCAKRSALAGSLHYTDLQEVPGLSGVNTTVEHVAQHCWQELASAVQDAACRRRSQSGSPRTSAPRSTRRWIADSRVRVTRHRRRSDSAHGQVPPRGSLPGWPPAG